MSRPFQVNTNKDEDIIDVPFTEVEQEKVDNQEGNETVEAPNDGVVIDLDEVEYMVMIGRKKDGEIFFVPYQLSDLIVMDSLVSYAQKELDFSFNRHFHTKALEAQEALRAQQEADENGEG